MTRIRPRNRLTGSRLRFRQDTIRRVLAMSAVTKPERSSIRNVHGQAHVNGIENLRRRFTGKLLND